MTPPVVLLLLFGAESSPFGVLRDILSLATAHNVNPSEGQRALLCYSALSFSTSEGPIAADNSWASRLQTVFLFIFHI